MIKERNVWFFPVPQGEHVEEEVMDYLQQAGFSTTEKSSVMGGKK